MQGWSAPHDYESVETRLVRNVPKSWDLILGYQDLSDLINKIKQQLTIAPGGGCLKALELVAHGNPVAINGMTRVDVSTWATQLKTLTWCDEAKIYLSACNTGLKRNNRNLGANRIGPIAKHLAESLPFDAQNFAHKIEVYGSNGYLSGTASEGTEETITDFTEFEWSWSVPPVRRVVWPAFPGSKNATKSACWNKFKNGNW